MSHPYFRRKQQKPVAPLEKCPKCGNHNVGLHRDADGHHSAYCGWGEIGCGALLENLPRDRSDAADDFNRWALAKQRSEA